MNKEPAEKNIFQRAFLVYALSGILAIVIVVKMILIQTIEGSDLRERIEQTTYRYSKIEGHRGNIYSADGSLLATTIPHYEISFDTKTADSVLFYEKIDSLSICLSKYFKDKSAAEYKLDFISRREAPNKQLTFTDLTKEQIDDLLKFSIFKIPSKKDPEKKAYINTSKDGNKYEFSFNTQLPTNEEIEKDINKLSKQLSDYFVDKTAAQYKKEILLRRNSKSRTVKIGKGLDYLEMKDIKSFPIFNKHKYTGGLIVSEDSNSTRINPFVNLAPRTIGRKNVSNPYGLEVSFDNVLSGKKDTVLQKLMPGPNVWADVDDQVRRSSLDGKDLITTIDVHLQDIAATALKEHLKANKAKSGCVVLMEVKTGEIRAISNLTMTKDSSYIENKNYAVGDPYEPGSSFKLMTMVAGLEDGFFDLDEEFNTGDGSYKMGKYTIKDSRSGGYGKLTLREIFEHSSNVGTVMAVNKYYGQNPAKYFKSLFRMGLNQPLGVDIPGEGRPAFRKTMSKISMLSTSYGYSLQLTPLQILAFYNAVANNGKMVKPMFVKQIQYGGQIIKTFEPIIIREICSEKNAKLAQELLRGVVTKGTAKNLSQTIFPIAGKTATARMIENGAYSSGSYHASFVGYFPADNPQYSCIVVVAKPTQGKYYGGTVAAPVFLEIAEKVYATHSELKSQRKNINTNLVPIQVFAKAKVVNNLYQSIGIKNIFVNTKSKNDYVKIMSVNDSLIKSSPSFDNSRVPNLKGMSVNEAVSLVETLGAKVNISGKGWVVNQQPAAGVPLKQGTIIKLTLGKR